VEAASFVTQRLVADKTFRLASYAVIFIGQGAARS
jgi:hypothetical protein